MATTASTSLSFARSTGTRVSVRPARGAAAAPRRCFRSAPLTVASATPSDAPLAVSRRALAAGLGIAPLASASAALAGELLH